MSTTNELLQRARQILDGPKEDDEYIKLVAALVKPTVPHVYLGIDEKPDKKLTAFAVAERAIREALRVSVDRTDFEMIQTLALLQEEYWTAQMDWWEEELHKRLPQHCRVIHEVFGTDNPDDPNLDGDPSA